MEEPSAFRLEPICKGFSVRFKNDSEGLRVAVCKRGNEAIPPLRAAGGDVGLELPEDVGALAGIWTEPSLSKHSSTPVLLLLWPASAGTRLLGLVLKALVAYLLGLAVLKLLRLELVESSGLVCLVALPVTAL